MVLAAHAVVGVPSAVESWKAYERGVVGFASIFDFFFLRRRERCVPRDREGYKWNS